jgi:hypothetical protein
VLGAGGPTDDFGLDLHIDDIHRVVFMNAVRGHVSLVTAWRMQSMHRIPATIVGQPSYVTSLPSIANRHLRM